MVAIGIRQVHDKHVGKTKRILILGGGFGGLQSALGLANKDLEVTLVDRNNHHLFQPLLYQVATAGLAPGSIASPIRSILSHAKNIQVLMGEARRVDTQTGAVTLDDGTVLHYDKLIIAIGAQNNFFGHESTWGKYALGLKSIRDAVTIREEILLAFERAEKQSPAPKRDTTFVVIGAGPTGVEMAGAISELGRQILAKDFRAIRPADIRVLLIEMADRVLSPFDPKLSDAAAEQLRELGVELRLGEAVRDIDAQGVVLDSERIDAAVVVWASGVRIEELEWLGEQPDFERGRIAVDEDCSILRAPNVFAIGDVAFHIPAGHNKALPGLGAVAMQQGKYVAKVIDAELRGQPKPIFRYKDRGIMATIGRSRAVVQSRIKLSGTLAWAAWLFVHLFLLIGFRNRAIVLFNWAWSYLTFKRGARLIAKVSRPRSDGEER